MIDVTKLDHYIEHADADVDDYFRDVPPEEVKALALKLSMCEQDKAQMQYALEQSESRFIEQRSRLDAATKLIERAGIDLAEAQARAEAWAGRAGEAWAGRDVAREERDVLRPRLDAYRKVCESIYWNYHDGWIAGDKEPKCVMDAWAMGRETSDKKRVVEKQLPAGEERCECPVGLCEHRGGAWCRINEKLNPA